MFVLLSGIALWWGAFLFNGLAAEEARSRLKMLFLVAKMLALLLMIFGYRTAETSPIYTPPEWTTHLNNLLMLLAVGLLGMGHSKGRARSWFRHPMLMSVAVWAAAHLLVNGDLASVLLFGLMLIWALFEMALINRRAPAWQPKAPGPASGDVRLLIITLGAYAIIAALHTWLGPWPFGG